MEEKLPAGLAIASMVLGIVALVLGCCLGPLGLIVTVVGLVLGIIALKKVNDGTGGGKGFAIAGIIMSALSLPTVLIMTLFLGGAMMSGFSEAALLPILFLK